MDKNGNKLTFSYGQVGSNNTDRVVRVEDTRDRAAVLGYDNDALMTSMEIVRDTDGSGGSNDETLLRWEYTYSGNPAVMTSSQLVEVSDNIDSESGVDTVQDNDPNEGALT